MRVWSQYQAAVFANVASGQGHTVVKARAGSGKTTAILECFAHIPPGETVLMCAFGKDIETELQKRNSEAMRLNPGRAPVTIATLHSFGFAAVKRAFGRAVKVDKFKVDNILVNLLGEEQESRELRQAAAKVVSLCKATLSESAEEIDSLLVKFGIEIPGWGNEAPDEQAFARLVAKTLVLSFKETKLVDFDDMVYMPVKLGLKVETFDRVFIDETQDLNRAQIALALKACKKNGRILAVGDDRQAIFAFRGADANAVPNVIEALKATVLPLSVTYRCCKAVVRLAQEIVPDLEAAPEAIEGSVSPATIAEMKKEAQPGDFILSRANAPLVGLCLSFLKEGRKASIAGRDITSNLLALVKKSKQTKISLMLVWLDGWKEREVARLSRKTPLPQTAIDAIVDKAECIEALCEGLENVAELSNRLESLFADEDKEASNRIVLSSTHKAKGLERNRVWVLESTYRKRPTIEEDNLWYVAVTRAKETLRLVS